MDAKKNYDELFREWWINKFSNKQLSLNSFFKTLEKEKVQMASFNPLERNYQIFAVIEGDTLLVNVDGFSYCILYPRHREFIRLIFPGEDKYKDNMFNYPLKKL